MSRATLKVDRLIASGFEDLGCWEVSEGEVLRVSAPLPAKAGVYAFAVNGEVQYVGVAAKSLHQRFGFYVKPGRTQTTSIRLNETIRTHLHGGSTVRVLVAHPPDVEWNSLKLSGPEGLEAGLIRDFDLPWNVRGARPAARSAVMPSQPRRRKVGTANTIIDLVRRRPGMTELEIAKAVYGPSAVQQQVNQHCRALVHRRLLHRQGKGGQVDPYRYFAGE